jgi:5-guanidino-2-oxopentanoate decarboxylase
VADTLTCGQALVGLLERYDVDTVFGIPGTHTIELYRGLVSSSIRHVLARHEQGAAFMADGYSRVSGKPGVCFLIAGPGVMNAATAIASAYNDSIPLLIITSVTHHGALGKAWGEGHEMHDQRATLTPITAFSATVHQPNDLPDLVGKAYSLFAAGRPRPVHIEVPTNLFPAPISSDVFDREWLPRVASRPPGANSEDIEAAAHELRAAEKPMIYVGGGAKRASREVTALAEQLAAPVAHTVGGIGVLAGSHPLNLGSVSFETTRAALESADVLLALGTEMGSVDRWYNPIAPRGRLIRVDIDPLKLSDHYRAQVAINADAGLAAKAISERLHEQATSVTTSEAHTLAEHNRAQSAQSLTPLEQKHCRVWETLQAAVPASTRFFGDMCQLAYTACRMVSSEQPGHQIHPIGFGCLGFALPAALGARCALLVEPIVVVSGDSGLLYTVQEMACAFDESLPVILILWNNYALGEIRDGFIRRGIQPIAVSPRPPDNLMLAKSFGWHAQRVNGHQSLRTALGEALDKAEPSLIEVLESDEY